MTTNKTNIRLFSKEGRLIKNISRGELPRDLPEIIEYAGNFFIVGMMGYDYVERPVYHYAEQQVAETSSQSSVAAVPKFNV